VPEWSAAVLVDRECEETLQMVEFANMQLLEFRHIDRRIDDRLAGGLQADPSAHPIVATLLADAWSAVARLGRVANRNARDVRADRQRLEAGGRTKYLARCYKLLATRFHLAEWEKNIGDALEVVQGTYQVLSDQAASLRIELLEAIVIVLIAFEIIMPFLRK